MRIRTAIRKTVKWGGAAAVVLLISVWLASGWWWVYVDRPPNCFWTVREGRARLFWTVWPVGSTFAPAPSFDFGLVPPQLRPHFEWEFVWGDINALQSNCDWAIPLWFPTLIILLPTALAWREDRRAIFRARPGLCPDCGYDRRGIAAGGVCPECGAAAKAGMAS